MHPIPFGKGLLKRTSLKTSPFRAKNPKTLERKPPKPSFVWRGWELWLVHPPSFLPPFLCLLCLFSIFMYFFVVIYVFSGQQEQFVICVSLLDLSCHAPHLGDSQSQIFMSTN